MKLILLALSLLAISCGTATKLTGVTKARLKEIYRIAPRQDSLILKDRKDSTIHFKYTHTGIGRAKFYIGQWYIIRYDSAHCRPCDSLKWVRATIQRSH